MVLKSASKLDKNFMFQLFFLRETEDADVRIEEVEKLDFSEIKKRFELGESIFITRKYKNSFIPNSVNDLLARGSSIKEIFKRGGQRPWYFTHI